MAQKKRKSHAGAALGVGLALAAAAAAGGYFLYGTKQGAKHRKRIKGWTLQMKGEVLDKVEDVKDLNEKAYKEVVDRVAAKYKKMKKVDTKELEALAKELKSHWKNIAKHAQGKKRKTSPRKRRKATTRKRRR